MSHKKLKTRVKVCGITRLDDATLALELGAQALGFIFVKNSPRFIAFRRAKEIMTLLRQMDPKLYGVGVFVNESFENIDQCIHETGINALQLHGDESVEDCAKLKKKYPTLQIVKAMRPKDKSELESLKVYQSCDALLLDTYVPNLRGGSGVQNDFSLSNEAQAQHVHKRIIFSGGLNPDNILKALQSTKAYGYDVSSGLESEPGMKSEEKIFSFFNQIKSFESNDKDL